MFLTCFCPVLNPHRDEKMNCIFLSCSHAVDLLGPCKAAVATSDRTELEGPASLSMEATIKLQVPDWKQNFPIFCDVYQALHLLLYTPSASVHTIGHG